MGINVLAPFVAFGNTATSNVINGTYISGTISTGSISLTADSIPYVLGATSVSSGATLSIDSGAIIKFATSTTRLTVNGVLDVNGTTQSPVYFTSLKDDSAGGDTNNDGGSSGSAYDWKDIYINNNGIANIDHAITRYGSSNGGTNNGANIYNYNGTLDLINSTVSNGYYGVWQGSSTANSTISSSVISNNNKYGLYAQNGSANFSVSNSSIDKGNKYYGLFATYAPDVYAQYNWWGDASGPYPFGSGATVSSHVDYSNALTSTPVW